MVHPLAAKKSCPKCGSLDYRFRSRKTIPATEKEPEAVETKYRCATCGHVWRLRVVKGS